MVTQIRKVKTVVVMANEIVDDGNGVASERKVNEVIEDLKKGNKIVSILAHNAGIKPLSLIYDIIYEVGNDDKTKYTRYIKTVLSTVNEITKDESDDSPLEEKVNSTVDEIHSKGGKVIAFVPHNFGINPILIMYDIVYEAESPI